MTISTVLDKVVVDSESLFGIIDYVTSKHITFYALRGDDSPESSMLMVTYRSYYSHLRFSIFKSLYFPHFELDSPILINRRSINDCSVVLNVSRPRRRVLKPC